MAERRPPKTTRKPTVVWGLLLIETLAGSTAGKGVTTLARSIEMDLGQTHRLLAALVNSGYVFLDEASHTYRLTPKLVQLAAEFMGNMDLATASRPAMRELCAETGETVHLAAFAGSAPPVCVARELSPHPVSVSSDVGESFAFETSAIGKAVAEAREADGASRPSRYTLDWGTYRPSVVAAASPIFDWSGHVVGAIAVSGPGYRVSSERLDELGELVAHAASSISRTLGLNIDLTPEADIR